MTSMALRIFLNYLTLKTCQNEKEPFGLRINLLPIFPMGY